ncbi:LytR/AlgR family response regulator transcription factor [Parvicella tangerina]|uniref:Sensory transduction protein LytR n=1 Tax=Parvicella tangerina TaxID=2829795 RepID=A0A916JMA7_9FLAO|nr:LytTR family DNA-binding domain-containing protein [Parvicella tangerina]CAG5081701.1 Sensory transduction protein LytR [Parvicella tangerina]
MKAIIIEDEARARSLLRNLLESNCKDDIEHIYEATALKPGVELIKNHRPEIVFLDIEMPNEQGVEILNYFSTEEIDFDIVFTTAYSEFALKAFEMNAIDYILKPLRPSKVIEVVKKVKENRQSNKIQERLAELKKSLSNHSFNKIGLPVSDGILFLPIEEIINIEADGMYTKVFTINDGTLTISKPLKFYEHLLSSEYPFYRPHRSHLVNLKYLKQYIRKDGNYCLLENGNTIPISKEKKDEFLAVLTEI